MLAGSTKRGHAAYSRVHEILRQIEREWSAELGPKLFAQLKELLFRVSKPVNALAGLCLAVPLSCKWSSSLERRYSRCADCPHRTHSLGRERLVGNPYLTGLCQGSPSSAQVCKGWPQADHGFVQGGFQPRSWLV